MSNRQRSMPTQLTGCGAALMLLVIILLMACGGLSAFYAGLHS